MADRRYKLLRDGLVGPRSFSKGDLTNEDVPVWNSTTGTWDLAQKSTFGTVIADGTVDNSILAWNASSGFWEENTEITVDGGSEGLKIYNVGGNSKIVLEADTGFDTGIKFNENAVTQTQFRWEATAGRFEMINEGDMMIEAGGNPMIEINDGTGADGVLIYDRSNIGKTLAVQDQANAWSGGGARAGLHAVDGNGDGMGWITWYDQNLYMRVGEAGAVGGADGAFIRLDGVNTAGTLEVMAYFTVGGAVQLHYDNDPKFYTTAYGARTEWYTSTNAGDPTFQTGRSSSQHLALWGSSSGNTITSLSSTSNAKYMLFNATTDATNTVPSVGANGFIFQILGVEEVRIAADTMQFAGKTAFEWTDNWLRINDGATFSDGTYFGTGVLRTDGTFQVDSGGNTLVVNDDGGIFQWSTTDSQGGDFIVRNTDHGESNIIWYDNSANLLYLGNSTDTVTLRGDVTVQSGHSFNAQGRLWHDSADGAGFWYGISGDYSQSGGGSAWGATIWSLDTTWHGTVAGTDGGNPSYGLAWHRSSHAHVDAEANEGLYIFRNNTHVAAIGYTGAKFIAGIYPGDQSIGHIQQVAGNYGSVTCSGADGSSGTYRGWSIEDRIVFMNNNSTTSGMYNDTNNQWQYTMVQGGAISWYQAGTAVALTDTDGIRRNGAGNMIFHATDLGNGSITTSTSAPSGGGNGDVWFRY